MDWKPAGYQRLQARGKQHTYTIRRVPGGRGGWLLDWSGRTEFATPLYAVSLEEAQERAEKLEGR